MKTNQSDFSALETWSESFIQNLGASLVLNDVKAGDALQRELITDLVAEFEETKELIQEDILTVDECHEKLESSTLFLFQQVAMRDEVMDSVQNPFELFVYFTELSKIVSEVLREQL